MNTNLTVRPADKKDLDMIVSITGSVIRDMDEALERTFEPLNKKREKEFFKDVLSDEDSLLLVVEEETHLVGYAYARLRTGHDIYPSPYVEIMHIAIGERTRANYDEVFFTLLSEIEGWSLKKAARAVEGTIYYFWGNLLPEYQERGYTITEYRVAKVFPGDPNL